jgi:hypothetical protein
MIGNRYQPWMQLCFDAYSEKSLPSILTGWEDYGAAQAHYTVIDNKTVVLKASSATWVGRFPATVPSTGSWTIMFDYWATTDGSSLVLDNDGVMDNTYNVTLTANVAKQSYTGTVSVTSTGLIQHYFRRNAGGDITVSNVKFVKSDTYYDIITGKEWGSIGDPAWANNQGFLTISIVLQWYQAYTGYALHPISKFNSTLQNASMTLYTFGNYSGNGADGQWQFIAGNGGWTGLGSGGAMTFNQKHHIVLQYDMNSGCQPWFNGVKNGGIGAGGILGNSHTAGTGALSFSGASLAGNGQCRMYHLSWWNCKLPDDEIVNQYNFLKSRYSVV